jgi:hypothetical protein
MERLHKLLHTLNEQQVKILKKYLTSFSTRDPNTKFWELAEMLIESPEKVLSQSVCSEKLYGSKTDHRILKLKNRLYTKVLDSLLIDINTNRDIYEDELHPIQVRMRKKMILFDLLKYTPLKSTLGMEMITDIISTSKEYEFYPILLDAMYILKWNYTLKKGIDYFNKINKQIEFYEKCKSYSQRALDLSIQVGQTATFNSKEDKAKHERFLSDSINELREAFLETKVSSVGYYLKTFEMNLLSFQKKRVEAKNVALSMIEFLKANKNLGRKTRFGVWYGYISQIETELGEYDSALKSNFKSREYFINSPLNIAISKKHEFQIRFLMEDYSTAMNLVDELTSTSTEVTGDFRHDIFLFYKGCVHFALKEFRECARLMNLKFQLTKDKLGWEINIRFMRIMVMLELGKPDEAHKMVETVSKHIERYQKITDLTKRDQLLLKLFRELAREGFGFFRPSQKVFHYLLLLKEKGKEESWEPLSPELIQVHLWAINKYERFALAGSTEKVKSKPRKKLPAGE